MSCCVLWFAALTKLLQPTVSDARLIQPCEIIQVVQRNCFTVQIRGIHKVVALEKQVELITENDVHMKVPNKEPSLMITAEVDNKISSPRLREQQNSCRVRVRHIQISQEKPNYKKKRRYQQSFFNTW